ncbi:hypothetical protein [Sphingomonas sp.]
MRPTSRCPRLSSRPNGRRRAMADIWIQGSFAFRCTAAECALIEEVANAGYALANDDAPDPPSAALLAAFPPDDANARWSGFREAFNDPEFPTIGADFIAETCPDDPSARIVCFASMDDFDAAAIAVVIQRCCPETLAKGPIGFEWAMTCSKPRIGEFGGGWCAIFADRIEIDATNEALSRALAGDGN